MDYNLQLEKLFEQEEFKREYYRQAAFARLSDQFLMLRKQRGLTQKELAEKAGTTQAVISRLENGSVKPSLDTIVKIAEALDAATEVRLVRLEEIDPYKAPKQDCSEAEKKKKKCIRVWCCFGERSGVLVKVVGLIRKKRKNLILFQAAKNVKIKNLHND